MLKFFEPLTQLHSLPTTIKTPLSVPGISSNTCEKNYFCTISNPKKAIQPPTHKKTRKMVMKELIFSLPLLSLLLFHCSTTLAQPAAAPAPPAPTNITKILEKAGQFTLLIRLMKSTQVGDQINTQLNTSSQGLTVFAPTDNAFQSLKAGTLNSLTDEQQVQLLQFHVLPNFLSTTNFQTASNPLRTQAGDNTQYGFPLNVTTSGNQVNVSTGVVNATVANTIYSDNQLAVYEVDKVLLPMSIFGPTPPAAAPAPAPAVSTTKKKKSSVSDAPSSDDTTTSGAISLTRHGIMVFNIGVAVIATYFL